MRVLLVAGALALLTAVAFAPVVDNGFVNYDDDLEITSNPHVAAGLTGAGAAWAFTSFHDANWVPLARLSLMLDAELFGLDPRAFHATNLLFHGAAVLLLFAALWSLTGALACSAFAAAVFAVHPLQVESVAWASLRKDVVSGACFSLSLLLYAHYAPARDAGVRGRARSLYLALLFAYALGLLAKQILVTLPFALLLLDAWPLGRLRDASGRYEAARLRRAVVEKLPLVALALAAAVVTVRAQHAWGTLQSFAVLPLGVRLENALVACATVLARCFWPRGLAVYYPHPGGSIPAWQVGAAGALLAGITALALGGLRRRPYLAVGWLLFLGMLAPLLGVVQIGEAALADRYSYLPLVGIALAVAWGLAEIAGRGRGLRRAAVGLALVAISALVLATRAQVRPWRDSIHLFEHALAVTEDNALAHLNLGLALTRAGRLDEASAQFDAALLLVPTSPMARGLLGELRLEQGRWQEAAEQFRAALAGPRDPARWHAGLAWASFRLGELEQAAEHYRASLRLDPQVAYRHANLAAVSTALGDLDGAIESYRRALALDPRLEVRDELAVALARRGETETALAVLAEAIALAPAGAELRALRAGVLERAGREGEALAGYRAALELALQSGRDDVAERIRVRLRALEAE